MDPNIAGKRVGENNPQLFRLHWPWEDELILPIVTSINDKDIFSMVNAAIACLPDPTKQMHDHWGCQKESMGDGGA